MVNIISLILPGHGRNQFVRNQFEKRRIRIDLELHEFNQKSTSTEWSNYHCFCIQVLVAR